jgi:hypothetical protein
MKFILINNITVYVPISKEPIEKTLYSNKKYYSTPRGIELKKSENRTGI